MASSSKEPTYTRGTIDGGMNSTYRVGLGTPGGTEIVEREGRPRAIYTGDKIFYEDPEQAGRFRSHTRSSDYMDVSGYSAPTEAPEQIGPAVVGAPAPAPNDWRDDVDMTRGDGSAGSGPGLTTDEIVDNSGMQNWMNMGPQTAGEHVNALVDPSNWQYQVDPANQRVRNLGRYQNPMLDEWMNSPQYQGGLLALNKGLV